MKDRLAIVGSRKFKARTALEIAIRIIEDELRLSTPEAVISGGAPGVDTTAAYAATSAGVPLVEMRPVIRAWIGGYRERNMAIAQDCDRLLAIICAHSVSYGSGWTRDRAAALGRPTRTVTIKADGTTEDSGWVTK